MKCLPENSEEFLSECLHYNLNIIRDGKTMHDDNWITNGILCIKHLVGLEGKFLNFNEFKDRFPHVRTNFLLYEGVIRAIKEYQKKVGIELISSQKHNGAKVWNIINKGNKAVRQSISKNENVPTAVQKWNTKFEIQDNWDKIFKRCQKVTKDTRLKWFQLRLLHRILPTNKFLFLCKISESASCTFCKEEEETICHLFWDCRVIQRFWKDFLELLKRQCAGCNNLILSKALILFGEEKETQTDAAIDLILLSAKYYIHRCRLQDSMPILHIFQRMMKETYEVEKYSSQLENKSYKFDLQWFPYLNIVN